MEIYFVIFFIFLFGLVIGSFLNCLCYRVYKEKSMWGRSFCPKCLHQIRWYDNVPVLSWLILRGKCRDCKKAISIQYPVVEFITGILFVVVFFVNLELDMLNSLEYSIFLKFARDLFIICVLIVIFIIDFKWFLILDKVTIPAMLIVFGLNLALGMDWKNLLISGIIGGSFFLLQYLISKGKWLGGGDIRMGALMGLMLGWPMVMLAIFLAYIFGSVLGISLLIIGKKKMSSKLPLGTFLAPATLIVLLWGAQILDWYLRIIF